jgi:hypothetical protein
MTNTLEATIAAHLSELGWKRLTGGTAIASKSYATAVGPKEALVYLQDFGSQCDYVGLAGEYVSEGRNALDSQGQLIPRSAEGDALLATVQRFAADCDAAVAQTYAARLLHTR